MDGQKILLNKNFINLDLAMQKIIVNSQEFKKKLRINLS